MENRKRLVRRLQIVEGHVRAIQRMTGEGEYCIDIIRQIDATKAALSKVSQLILEDHLNSCVTHAVRGDDVEAREKVLQEIAEMFERSAKS
ncbi:MAG: metal-sensing transcriptional repressor [Thermoflexales bacterium]|nr:metal-sensing transcriptional repressor [Thermoflexales bacterium]